MSKKKLSWKPIRRSSTCVHDVLAGYAGAAGNSGALIATEILTQSSSREAGSGKPAAIVNFAGAAVLGCHDPFVSRREPDAQPQPQLPSRDQQEWCPLHRILGLRAGSTAGPL